MTIRYVDVGAGASDDYDPSDRSVGGGGGFNNYITIAAARDAASAGDTVYLRSGTEAVQTAQITINKAISIRSYGDEIHTLIFNGNVDGLNFSVVAPDVDCGKGQLVIAANDSKTLNEHAVQYAITGGRISGIDFRLWTGSLIRHLSASTTLTSERCIVGPAHLGFSKANATNVLTCNAYLFNGGLCSLSVGSQTITLNNPTFIGCTTSGPPVLGEGNTAGVDIIANNPILIGANQSDTGQTRYRLRAGTGATLVVNGGIVHRNINDRLVTYNTAGNVTLNSVDENALVKFENSNRCFVTLALYNSSYAATSEGAVCLDVITAVAPYGVKLAMILDDWHSYSLANYNPNIQAWINAGHELDSLGMSGGDDWDTTQPMKITYTDGGAGETNVALVISDNGETWTITADSGILAGPYDCSYLGSAQYLGLFQANGNHVSETTVCERMENDVLNGTELVITYNTGTSTGWDDTYASSFDDGTYPLVSGVGNADMTVNATRRMETEIGRSATLCKSLFGIYPTVMHTVAGSEDAKTAESTYARSVGYRALYSGWRAQSSNTIDTISAENIYKVTKDELSMLKDGDEATPELVIRAACRSIASYGLAIGAYIPINLIHLPTLGGGNPQWTAEEVGWMVDELTSAGVEIVTFGEALDLASTTTPVPLTDFVLASDSAGWGTAARFWTGPEPTGMDGEPFSDFDTDCGAYQSTTGPFHPVNL